MGIILRAENAVVAGATRGMGLAITKWLVAKDYYVSIFDSKPR